MDHRPSTRIDTITQANLILKCRKRGHRAKPSRALYVFENRGERIPVRPFSLVAKLIEEISHWTMLASKAYILTIQTGALSDFPAKVPALSVSVNIGFHDVKSLLRRKDLMHQPISDVHIDALARYPVIAPAGLLQPAEFSAWYLDRRIVNESIPVSCEEAGQIVQGTWSGNLETRFAMQREVDVAISAFQCKERGPILYVNLCSCEYRYNRHSQWDMRVWPDFPQLPAPVARAEVWQALTDLWASSYMILCEMLPIQDTISVVQLCQVIGVQALPIEHNGENNWLQFGQDQTTPEEMASPADPFGCHTILTGRRNVGSVAFGAISKDLVIIDGKPCLVYNEGLLEIFAVTSGLFCLRRVYGNETETKAKSNNACVYRRGEATREATLQTNWRLGRLHTVHCSVPSRKEDLEFLTRYVNIIRKSREQQSEKQNLLLENLLVNYFESPQSLRMVLDGLTYLAISGCKVGIKELRRFIADLVFQENFDLSKGFQIRLGRMQIRISSFVEDKMIATDSRAVQILGEAFSAPLRLFSGVELKNLIQSARLRIRDFRDTADVEYLKILCACAKVPVTANFGGDCFWRSFGLIGSAHVFNTGVTCKSMLRLGIRIQDDNGLASVRMGFDRDFLVRCDGLLSVNRAHPCAKRVLGSEAFDVNEPVNAPQNLENVVIHLRVSS